MKFYVKADGALIVMGVESNNGVELLESTKKYRSLEDAMTDVVGIVEMCRKAEIHIIDRTILEDGEEKSHQF